MLDNLNQPKGATIGILEDGRTVQEAFDDMSKLLVQSSGASLALMPRLMEKLYAYRYGTSGQGTFVVHGYGSSVGNGATLPDRATQAPVMKFFEYMMATVNPGDIYPFTVENRSVDGSNINDFNSREWPLTEAGGVFPDLAVFAYGMNDFPSAQFNAGMTFGANGFKQRMTAAVQRVQARGGDVVLLTSPHPYIETYDWTMPASIDMVWPSFLAGPVGAEQMVPPASKSVIQVAVGDSFIAQGHRFVRGNQAIREVAAETGCVLIDVEKFWWIAVKLLGNINLFNVGQTVHPNLLGHQLSYWKASEVFWSNVGGSAWYAPDVARNYTLDVGGTGLYPAKREADVDIQLNALRTRGMVVRDKWGRAIKEVSQSGIVEESWYTSSEPTVSSPGYTLKTYRSASRVRGLYSTGDTLSLAIPNQTEAKIMINVWTSAQTSWTQLQEYLVSNREGVLSIALVSSLDTTPGDGGSSTPTDGRRLFSVSTSGGNLVVTIKQELSSLKYSLFQFGT